MIDSNVFSSKQKKAITKLSKLSVGSLSAIDKLETQLSDSRRDGSRGQRYNASYGRNLRVVKYKLECFPWLAYQAQSNIFELGQWPKEIHQQ